MWVVKLGGSLWDSVHLKEWADQLGGSSHPLAVVPGGGPFADQVRRAQAHWRFDDQSAHRMALLAMEQMAHMLCTMHPRLQAVAERAAFTAALNDGRVPVWLPSQMVLRERQLPESWTVTSDSLAAWLAGRLGADGLILVKSARLPAATSHVSSLQESELLDRAFARFGADAACPVRMLNREHSGVLAALMNGDTGPAVQVAF